MSNLAEKIALGVADAEAQEAAEPQEKASYLQALEKIVKDPAALGRPCRTVDMNDPQQAAEVRSLIGDLTETATALRDGAHLSCLGLAANQLGSDLRVFVVWDEKKKRFHPYVNPEMLLRTKKFASSEGCFSRPAGEKIECERYREINVRAQGERVRKLRGIEAVAFQHELDHLNGVLI